MRRRPIRSGARLLRANHAELLIWHEARPFPPSFASPLPTLLSAPKEWHLLYVNGRAAAFGWKAPSTEEPPAPDAFAALRIQLEKSRFRSRRLDRAGRGAAAQSAPLVVGVLDSRPAPAARRR